MVCLRLLLALLTWTHTAAQSPYLTIFPTSTISLILVSFASTVVEGQEWRREGRSNLFPFPHELDMVSFTG